jgi:hypothetical protein
LRQIAGLLCCDAKIRPKPFQSGQPNVQNGRCREGVRLAKANLAVPAAAEFVPRFFCSQREPLKMACEFRKMSGLLVHMSMTYRICCEQPWRALCAAVVALVSGAAFAQNVQLPTLHTDESYVDEVTRATALNLGDPMAVFAFVLNSLPDRVKVYPTENYYYFSFFQSGVKYAGNIRIEPDDNGGQTVHFVYFEEASEWHNDPHLTHIVLDDSRGVRIEKIDKFTYRISYMHKSVVFALNDLSDVTPPADVIAKDETFIGPIFDESAIRFFLVYNSRLKDFHYILDETKGVADMFVPTRGTNRILIGKRTGFAFYRDHHLDRKILIGVYEGNLRANTYFDGPFDQLPDAFVKGDTLRNAILDVEPKLRGHIDRFGSEPGGEVRYMIAPYLPYRRVDDLYAYHRCASSRIHSVNYYDCFVFDKLGRAAARPGLGAPPARRSHGSS